jgi:uncharacterized protein YaaQ
MTTSDTIDQLFFVIVSSDQTGELTDKLVKNRFYFTRIDSSGGFLEQATVSLLVGINHERSEHLLQLIRTCCHTRRMYIPARVEPPMIQSQPVMIEAEVGGATIFTFDVELFAQI